MIAAVFAVVDIGKSEDAGAAEGGAGRASTGPADMAPNDGGGAGSGINCRKMRLTASTAWKKRKERM